MQDISAGTRTELTHAYTQIQRREKHMDTKTQES